MMKLHGLLLVLLQLLLPALPARGQEITSYRVLNVTLNTSQPDQMALHRGRLIWRDTDINSGTYFLKFYTGFEIVTLDSNLVGVTAALGDDYVVWNTPDQHVKAYDIHAWHTMLLGSSYNPDFTQMVSVSNGQAAFAQRKSVNGTWIVIHRFATGSDTILSAATWNTAPTIDHGQIAWVAADSEAVTSASQIYFFDGVSARNISATTGLINRSPILRDAQVAWLQSGPGASGVKVYTGDSLVTLVQLPHSTSIVAGYDLSDGTAIAAVRDTTTGRGTITVYSTDTGSRTLIADSSGVWYPHIDNGLIVWQSGTGPGKRLKTYTLQRGILSDVAAAEKPVVDDDRIAWTLGDAVEMYVPVTYQQLTTDGLNGWEQTKFKTIDSAHIIWGNFANANHMRLFWGNGTTTTELADSATTNDLVMANDGYVIWRRNFDSLFYFNGLHPPVKFLDTVQAENPYVGGGSIAFFGSRLTVNESIKHAWLYEINSGKLTMLSSDSGSTGNVLCAANTACWLNGHTHRLMFYDGVQTVALSDSETTYDYSYRNGKVVWAERRGGTWQIMMYDVVTKTKAQITADLSPKAYPITDGNHILWFENPSQVATTVSGEMWYRDLMSGRSWLVAHAAYSTLSWDWVSNGQIAWSQNGSLFVFDGDIVSQLTSGGFDISSGAYLDRGHLVWRSTPTPPTQSNGQIFSGKLHAHADFDAMGIAGKVPLDATFTNRSWEGFGSSSWDFGDGSSSTEPSPTHTYGAPGTYTVSLTVTGPAGQVTERKVNLIRAVSSSHAGILPGTPTNVKLYQNYPNPFNPKTVVSYELSVVSEVKLVVYDILGREVALLVNERREPGSYEVKFDAQQLATGVYFYRLTTGPFVQTRKMILVR